MPDVEVQRCRLRRRTADSAARAPPAAARAAGKQQRSDATITTADRGRTHRLFEIPAREDERRDDEQHRDVDTRHSRRSTPCTRAAPAAPWTTAALTSNGARFGSTQYSAARQPRRGRRLDDILKIPQVAAEVPDDEQPERQRRRQHRRREGREEQRDGRDEHQLDEDQPDRLEQRRIERRRVPRALTSAGRRPTPCRPARRRAPPP